MKKGRLIIIAAVLVLGMSACMGGMEATSVTKPLEQSSDPDVETAPALPEQEPKSESTGIQAYKAYRQILENNANGILFLQNSHQPTVQGFEVYQMERSIAFADIDNDGLPELVYSSIDLNTSGDDTLTDSESGTEFDWQPRLMIYRYKDGVVEKVYDESTPWARVDYAFSGCVFTTDGGICMVGAYFWGYVAGANYKEYVLLPEGMESKGFLIRNETFPDTNSKYFFSAEDHLKWDSAQWNDFRSESNAITLDEYFAIANGITDSVQELLLLDDWLKSDIDSESVDWPDAKFTEHPLFEIVEMQPSAMSYAEAIMWLNERI